MGEKITHHLKDMYAITLHWREVRTCARDPAENVMFVMCPPAVPEFITSIL